MSVACGDVYSNLPQTQMRALFIVLLILVSGCEQEVPSSAVALTESDIALVEEEISAMLADMTALSEKFEVPDNLENIFAEGHISISNGSAFWNKEEVIKMAEANAKVFSSESHENKIEILRSEIQVLSKMSAIATQRAKQTLKEKDGKVLADGLEAMGTYVWLKEDGKWKILHYHQSFIMPPTQN